MTTAVKSRHWLADTNRPEPGTASTCAFSRYWAQSLRPLPPTSCAPKQLVIDVEQPANRALAAGRGQQRERPCRPVGSLQCVPYRHVHAC
jgi:hypothetical protein